jgi:hypothetical protein
LLFCGTFIEYLPFISVNTPILVPFTVAATPAIGPSPGIEELTVPVMTLVCASSGNTHAIPANTSVSTSFFIRLNFKFTSYRVCLRPGAKSITKPEQQVSRPLTQNIHINRLDTY